MLLCPGYAVLVGTAGDPLGIPSGLQNCMGITKEVAAGLILAFLAGL